MEPLHSADLQNTAKSAHEARGRWLYRNHERGEGGISFHNSFQHQIPTNSAEACVGDGWEVREIKQLLPKMLGFQVEKFGVTPKSACNCCVSLAKAQLLWGANEIVLAQKIPQHSPTSRFKAHGSIKLMASESFVRWGSDLQSLKILANTIGVKLKIMILASWIFFKGGEANTDLPKWELSPGGRHPFGPGIAQKKHRWTCRVGVLRHPRVCRCPKGY